LHCPEKAKEDKPEEKRDEKPKPRKELEKSEKSTSKLPPSGTLYTAMSHGALLANRKLINTFYIDSGASDHLIPSKTEHHAYQEFERPVEISAADSGTIYAYSTGSLCGIISNGLERAEDLQDIYYTPGVHA
jgi:hypothetical protein